MPTRESTAVGYRLRIQPPGGLSTYPDAIKLLWYGWVTDLGLVRKRWELRRGWDKDGVIHPLAPRTIRYRKSEVGPTHKRAPRGIPALDLSRVMSLLRGRAHTGSAEFFWTFDAVTGRSFAVILHYWADDQGHDVFGLSASGVAWVTREATKRWRAWLAEGHHGRPAVSPVGAPVRKIPMTGRVDLHNMDLTGDESLIRRAIDAGQFTGFRRLNAKGEKWKPLAPAVKVRAAMKPAPKPAAVLPPTPVRIPVPLVSIPLDIFGRKALAAARLVPETQRYNYAKVWIVDAWEQFTRAYPGVTLEEFKARLWAAHQAGKIELARADTPGWGGAKALAKDRASRISIGDFATFEVIRVD